MKIEDQEKNSERIQINLLSQHHEKNTLYWRDAFISAVKSVDLASLWTCVERQFSFFGYVIFETLNDRMLLTRNRCMYVDVVWSTVRRTW